MSWRERVNGDERYDFYPDDQRLRGEEKMCARASSGPYLNNL